MLTKERVLELLSYNQGTGEFFWKQSGKGRKLGVPQGGKTSHGYKRLKIDGVEHLVHRIVWLVETGNFPQEFIDHINRDRSDNRYCNLREVSHEENNQNRSDNTSGHVGVSWSSNESMWVQQYRPKGKHFVSKHERIEDAILSRNEMVKSYKESSV